MYRIRVENEGTLPRLYETIEEALAAYKEIHQEHAERVGRVTVQDMVPITMADLLPDLRFEAFERIGSLRGDESALDAISLDEWADYQRFMRECAAEWAKLSNVELDSARVLSSTVHDLER